jgi:hypothetical protein
MIEKLNNSVKYKANIGASGNLPGSHVFGAMPAPIPFNQYRGLHHVSRN